MKINLKYKEEPFKEVVEFLNQPAIDFYEGKLEFADPNYPMVIKSLILQAMNDVEGAIEGQFNCDLFLRGINGYNKRLNEMFPVGCKVLDGSDVGLALSSIRNINAHAIPSSEDIEFISNSKYFKRLYDLPRLGFFIKFILSGGRVTVGGFITLVLLFLRAQSIKSLCKLSRVFQILASNHNSLNDGAAFVDRISHVNLELPIRQIKGSTLKAALFGEYENKLVSNNDYDTLIFGSPTYPNYKLTTLVDETNKHICVKHGSLTKVYYEADYELHIEDMDRFIELSNQFPPFVFVDLLYKLNVKQFDSSVDNEILGSMDLYSKLNYPKFYVDKNIDTLLLPPTVADFRIISTILSNSLSTLFLRLEKEIITTCNVKYDNQYSKFNKSLSLMNFSEDLILKLTILRNFCMHGYILNERVIYSGKIVKYDFDFIVSTLKQLLVEAKSISQTLYDFIQEDVHHYIVRRMLGLKYNSIVDYTLDTFDGNIKYDPNTQNSINKNLYVVSSYFDTTRLNDLYLDNPPLMIIECNIDKLEYSLFVYNNEFQISLLNKYLQRKYGNYDTEDHIEGVIQKVFITTKVERKLT